MHKIEKEKYSDRQLEKGIREKDNTIIKYIYDRYYPMTFELVNKCGVEESFVWDIFQDCLLEILIKFKDPEFSISYAFSSYFYSICKNKVLDLQRKGRAVENYLAKNKLEEKMEHPVESTDNENISSELIDAFNSLGTNCKTILNLHFRDIPLMEIARIISVEYTTVRKRKERCIVELKEKISTNPTIKCMLINNPDTSQFMLYEGKAV